MYKDFKTDDEYLYVTDDKGKTHKFPNSIKLLEQLKNENNVELLKNYLLELEKIRYSISSKTWKKYYSNTNQLMLAFIMIIFFIIGFVFTGSPIMTMLLFLNSLFLIKTSIVLMKNKYIINLEQFDYLHFEIVELIEYYRKEIEKLENSINIKIEVEEGLIEYNETMNKKYRKEIDELIILKNMLQENEKNNSKSHQKVLK